MRKVQNQPQTPGSTGLNILPLAAKSTPDEQGPSEDDNMSWWRWQKLASMNYELDTASSRWWKRKTHLPDGRGVVQRRLRLTNVRLRWENVFRSQNRQNNVQNTRNETKTKSRSCQWRLATCQESVNYGILTKGAQTWLSVFRTQRWSERDLWSFFKIFLMILW